MVCEDVMMATFDSRAINTDRWRDCLTERWLLDSYKLEGAKFSRRSQRNNSLKYQPRCGGCNAEVGHLHWKYGHSGYASSSVAVSGIFVCNRYREACFLPWEYLSTRVSDLASVLFSRRLVIVCQKFLEFPGDFTSHLLQTRVWLLELWIWNKNVFLFLSQVAHVVSHLQMPGAIVDHENIPLRVRQLIVD